MGAAEQHHNQADGTMLIGKSSFLEVADATPTHSRSKCDNRLERDCREFAARMDRSPIGTADGSATSHQLDSESVSVASGSRCSWAEISDSSQYNISGYCVFSDDSQDECCGNSSSAPGGSHPANRILLFSEERDVGEQRDAAWQAGIEEQHAAHAAGHCNPCLYVSAKLGCLNGANCNFCHLPHAVKSRSRPSKAVRVQVRNLVETLDSKCERDPHAALGRLADTFGARGSGGEYMLSILRARDQQQAAGEDTLRAGPRAKPGRQPRHG
ncbi:unnamed protein product [Prorocentrum cordatum]|uniref:C3H1-type domain-containing protein n=1 Tax=Prorocentrum cordatum TaxID=2364126 RepID=A0ABN9T643_9DINO|nr:unnamed protein product [Polarella glacialis]